MNYYERHIGDWIGDTVNLTMLEDGAYNRLIDQYYRSEKPLPLDHKELFRLARASSSAERKAVLYVISTFFTHTEFGYTQKRAQAVIEQFWERDQAAEGKRENDRERQQRARERRKQLFEELRNLGIVPEFNTPTKQLSLELSRVTNRDNKLEDHAIVTRDNTATQSPDTSNQKTTSAPSEKISLGADGWENIPGVLMAQWREAYPATNLDSELAKAAAWLIANPRNRKSNYARFLTNWLTKAQDRAPRMNGLNGHSDNPFA